MTEETQPDTFSELENELEKLNSNDKNVAGEFLAAFRKCDKYAPSAKLKSIEHAEGSLVITFVTDCDISLTVGEFNSLMTIAKWGNRKYASPGEKLTNWFEVVQTPTDVRIRVSC